MGIGASLEHAQKLLDYVEESEWQKSGFFLRSRWPGNVHHESDRPYFPASVDEIAGLLLGLYYLDDALNKVPDYDLRAQDISARTRLQEISTRMGEYFAKNSYFLLPPEGAPFSNERHKGWGWGRICLPGIFALA